MSPAFRSPRGVFSSSIGWFYFSLALTMCHWRSLVIDIWTSQHSSELSSEHNSEPNSINMNWAFDPVFLVAVLQHCSFCYNWKLFEIKTLKIHHEIYDAFVAFVAFVAFANKAPKINGRPAKWKISSASILNIGNTTDRYHSIYQSLYSYSCGVIMIFRSLLEISFLSDGRRSAITQRE